MALRSIPQGQWEDFCDRFSDEHRGWLVRVEVVAGQDTQVLAVDLALQGISVDRGSSDVALYIAAGSNGTGRINHRVERPSVIRFEATEQGAHAGLKIESADGVLTNVRFRVPANPETLDGFMP